MRRVTKKPPLGIYLTQTYAVFELFPLAELFRLPLLIQSVFYCKLLLQQLIQEQLLNPVAELDRPDSGNIIIPDQAKLGDKLFCPDYDCKDKERKLFLKHSSLGNAFFSHRPGFSHPIYGQTLLHKLAIEWFSGKTAFEIPSGIVHNVRRDKALLLLDSYKTELEFRQYQNVIPDVIVETLTGFRFAIEIVVTNDVSPEKTILLHESKLPTVCIDLTDFYHTYMEACRADIDFIKANLDTLLQDIALKRWVRSPSNENKENKKKDGAGEGCLLSLVLLGVITFAIYIGIG